MHKENVMYLYVYTMEYYNTQLSIIQPLQRKETLPFAIAWVKLECIMLSEISRTENNKYCMISLICKI